MLETPSSVSSALSDCVGSDTSAPQQVQEQLLSGIGAEQRVQSICHSSRT
jgi:hypothetical protein